MSDQKFPPGWDEARIRVVIEHYDSQDEDERAAEIEAAWEAEGMTLMSVPTELVPEIRGTARPQADRLTRPCSGPGHAGSFWSCKIGHRGRCAEISGRSRPTPMRRTGSSEITRPALYLFGLASRYHCRPAPR